VHLREPARDPRRDRIDGRPVVEEERIRRADSRTTTRQPPLRVVDEAAAIAGAARESEN
jgi:hypothetical protein